MPACDVCLEPASQIGREVAYCSECVRLARLAMEGSAEAWGSLLERERTLYDRPRPMCDCRWPQHELGSVERCEGYKHHCDSCHEKGLCTAHGDEDQEPTT